MSDTPDETAVMNSLHIMEAIEAKQSSAAILQMASRVSIADLNTCIHKIDKDMSELYAQARVFRGYREVLDAEVRRRAEECFAWISNGIM